MNTLQPLYKLYGKLNEQSWALLGEVSDVCSEDASSFDRKAEVRYSDFTVQVYGVTEPRQHSRCGQ